jgi:hypothetical protein
LFDRDIAIKALKYNGLSGTISQPFGLRAVRVLGASRSKLFRDKHVECVAVFGPKDKKNRVRELLRTTAKFHWLVSYQFHAVRRRLRLEQSFKLRGRFNECHFIERIQLVYERIWATFGLFEDWPPLANFDSTGNAGRQHAAKR